MAMTSAYRSSLVARLGAGARDERATVERALGGPQGAWIEITGRRVLNLCSNDYLGLANDPDTIGVAARAHREHGFGYAAGRIICGTSTIHRALEEELSDFLGHDDAMLFTSCFDANVGLVDALLGPEDVVISDRLNHASIIDGIRLSKARRATYRTRDLAELEAALVEFSDARQRLVITDGVFSMDGGTAPLLDICDLAERYQALVVVDDSHGIGVLGKDGRGVTAEAALRGRIDLVTGTLGKALGGAGGGFVVGGGLLLRALRQSARPYVFSNALPPAQVQVARWALEQLCDDDRRRRRLLANTGVLREALLARGLSVPAGEHPIIPVMIGDEGRARRVAAELLDMSVLAVSLTYPVVETGKARIRLQVSAAHDPADLEMAAGALAAALEKHS